MTPKALVYAALLAALCAACHTRPSQSQTATAGSQTTASHSGGQRDGFPDPATYAEALDDPKRDAWQKPREVMAMLDVHPGMVVVDLGVGTGYFLPYLSAAVGREGGVIALDTDRGMIERVRARIEQEALDQVEPQRVAPDDPALATGSVDRILVVDTWHHITSRAVYAQKLRGALRRGGQLLIVDFEMDSPVGPPPTMRLTPDTVLRELRAAGFETERLAESLPYQYAIMGRVP